MSVSGLFISSVVQVCWLVLLYFMFSIDCAIIVRFRAFKIIRPLTHCVLISSLFHLRSICFKERSRCELYMHVALWGSNTRRRIIVWTHSRGGIKHTNKIDVFCVDHTANEPCQCWLTALVRSLFSAAPAVWLWISPLFSILTHGL